MSRRFILCLGLLLLGGCHTGPQSPDSAGENPVNRDPLKHVNPFIGTGGKGKTFPGATVPHGMVQLSPDNGRGGWDWIAGYFYPDNIIAGFSHTHLSGTGAGDLYDISYMPLTRPYRYEKTEGGPARGTIVSTFSHSRERASPGYYQVYLSDYDINVELTAGLRTGFQRYRFPANRDWGVVRLNLGYSRNWDKTIESHLRVIDDRTIAGYRKSTGWAKDQRVFFYTRFSRPFAKYTILESDQRQSGAAATGINTEIELDFDLTASTEVTLRTGLSSVSMDSARHNLLDEGEDKSFAQVRREAEQAWRGELGKIEVEADPDNLQQFYTAMYHASLAPRIYSDADGRYKGPDGGIHQAEGYRRYDFFSLWDTFRALHPWKTLIDPQRTREMMASILSHYEVTGRLPVWIFQGNETDMMMGYHAVPVLVDAYRKGLLQVDGNYLLEAAVQSATQQDFGVASYRKLGYVPYEERGWNVSLTLEYAYDDWAIAQLAQALGDTQRYRQFSQRAQNYRHHFDPATGFMRARNTAGQFREPFDPNAYHPEDYCEANAWQYSFFVPHDVEGLVALIGGPEKFAQKLDAMFTTGQSIDAEMPEWISGYIGQYVHGNEPSHHIPYLYQYVDQGFKTQSLVRRIMDELYTTAPDGLAGNEDAGQMSAWYLFSALGFYPVDPVSGRYVLGSPEVHRARINLDSGRHFTIRADNQARENVYVSSVHLNGERLARSYITHDEILAGGELVFTMSATPP